MRSPKSCEKQLDIWRLAAARTGAGEFEQRLEELHAAHIGEINARAIVDWKALEERDIGARSGPPAVLSASC